FRSGDALSAGDQAAASALRLGQQVDAVRSRAHGAPVPTLLAVGDSGQFLAGPGTYLDDLLKIAGGKNVAAALNNPYPSVDREQLLTLKPEVIIQLLPGASPQVVEKSRQFWQMVGDLPAVANGRVY